MTEQFTALECGCVPNNYMCGNHKRQRRAAAYQKLTPEQKDYDNHVDPRGWYHNDFPSGCSCHIMAPCGYCTRDVEVAPVSGAGGA